MRTIISSVIFLAALQTPHVSAEERTTCAKISSSEVESLFDRWNQSLETLDAKKVAENYSKNSVLLATLANDPRTTNELRVQYFEEFLKKKPRGHINNRTIQIGCNWAVDVGTYTFTMKDDSSVPARYTYTYIFENNEWLISSHHSSMMPQHL
jgi:uncharacterized protein (TIGR02246 family)